jgi:hypothetical protein
MLLMLMIWLQSMSSFAQVVSGSVKTTTGEALIGVNVMVKGTTKGTVTGVDDTFKLEDLQAHDILHMAEHPSLDLQLLSTLKGAIEENLQNESEYPDSLKPQG